MSTDRLVDVQGLGLHSGGRRRIANVEMIVEPGTVTGLVGPNGAGKTTILRILAGLLRATDGTGTVLGQDIRRRRAGARSRPGYMPQSSAVQPSLTVRELLHYRAALHRIADPPIAVLAAMDQTGLTALAANKLDALSGGWLRRADLAATIIARPRLLLLDEPTTGLDQDARTAIWAVIADLAAQGAGVVVNTHDLAEAERCDHLILLIDGSVAASGSPQSMLATTRTTRLEDAWPLLVTNGRP